MYNVTFDKLYRNIWDKCRDDDGILNSQRYVLGQFMMKIGGEYFEYGGWFDGKRGRLHDQELCEFYSGPNIAKVMCYSYSYFHTFKHLNKKAYSHDVRGTP
jgi:hypothetical protein